MVSSVNGLDEDTFTATSVDLTPSAYIMLLLITAFPLQSDTMVRVGAIPQLVVILAVSLPN